MSYLALARKWRPRTFSQLVGQEHINKALTNALNQKRLHHAYLFTGTRGVGKTSVARILAKALNCEQGISSEPCLHCDTCQSIEQGRFIDLIEIDGASRTRVEDTRELLDNVQYAPSSGQFKIYLIDEVHMLSQHSFNALLKTLEEPPQHVKFILATTDPQKIPVTVLSRCLQFHLKNLPSDLICQQLQLILKEESLDFEPDALNALAYAAQGSMRDALSLLDQAITSCTNKLMVNDINDLLGHTHQDYAIQFLNALTEKNPSKILTLSRQINNEGGQFQYVIDQILYYLHQATVCQNIGDANPLINLSPAIKKLSEQISSEDVQLFYHIALNGKEEMHLAPTLAIGFEMTIFRMLTFRPSPITKKTSFPTESSPHTISKNSLTQSESATFTTIDTLSNIPEPFKTAKTTELTSHMTKTSDKNTDWTDIIPRLKLTGLALNAIENSEYESHLNQIITLKTTKGHRSLFTPTTISRIEAALTQYFQQPIQINLIAEEVIHTSPAQQKERGTQQKQQKTELALLNDPVFQQIQQQFSAELVKNSIVPLKDDL